MNSKNIELLYKIKFINYSDVQNINIWQDNNLITEINIIREKKQNATPVLKSLILL